MKELTIEEKLEKAKMLYKDANADQRYVLESLFPELAEIEDVWIKKRIIQALHGDVLGMEETTKAIAWLEKQNSNIDNSNKEYWRGYHEGKQEILDKYAELEKQGEQKSFDYEKAHIQQNDFTPKSALEAIKGEKLDNQNCIKPADKVEPKFHEGEWVFIEEVKGYKNGPFQIKSVDSFGYSFDEYHTIPFMYEDLIFKWTIQDAMNGDVLSYNDSRNNVWVCIFKKYANERVYDYCTLDKESFREYGNWNYLASFSYTPAAKEQRDLLFKKMKEAGYEWDSENKKLKKIEQKPVEEYNITGIGSKNAQGKLGEIIKNLKPAWGEEDETMITDLSVIVHTYFSEISGIPFKYDLSEEKIRTWFNFLKDRVQPQPRLEWSEEDEKCSSYICAALDCYHRLREDRNNTNGQENLDKARNWLYDRLKSLRPQRQWKPSDEQMDAFDAVLVYNPPCSNECRNHLITLYNELKKLKEESYD